MLVGDAIVRIRKISRSEVIPQAFMTLSNESFQSLTLMDNLHRISVIRILDRNDYIPRIHNHEGNGCDTAIVMQLGNLSSPKETHQHMYIT